MRRPSRYNRGMRVLLIGPRRVHQGTGPYLARFLAEAGCPVTDVLASTPKTSAAGAAALAQDTGQRPPTAHATADAAFGSDPEVVVIASPRASHRAHLERALRLQAHILCEKPVLEPVPGSTADLEGLLAFASQGVLRVQAQWPYALPTYAALVPGPREGPFEMHLEPQQGSVKDMLADALPHPISLLQSTDGEGRVREVRFEGTGAPGEPLSVQFAYETAATTRRCRVSLRPKREGPRQAGFGWGAKVAKRLVDPVSYSMQLELGEGRIPMPDPTPLLVRSFLEDVQTRAYARGRREALHGLSVLEALVSAWTQSRPTPSGGSLDEGVLS